MPVTWKDGLHGLFVLALREFFTTRLNRLCVSVVYEFQASPSLYLLNKSMLFNTQSLAINKLEKCHILHFEETSTCDVDCHLIIW